MASISAVISAYNEEKKIEKCLASVSWVDEIIFINNSSTDRTVSIAQKYTSKIFKRANNKMLNINKNFGIQKAGSDWILYLDADEVVTPELKNEIIKTIQPKNNPTIFGYWLPRKNIIFGKWIRHGLWWPDLQLRLFRKGTAKYPCVHVHEKIKTDQPTGQLQSALLHNNYENIDQYLRKFTAIYADNEAENLLASGYVYRWYDAVRFPVSDFIKIYFAQKGYKDGLHGLVLAILQAFYSFVTFSKLWQADNFRPQDLKIDQIAGELDQNRKEFKYWILSSKISETGKLPVRIFYKLVRKIWR